jgi:hypothetical protein
VNINALPWIVHGYATLFCLQTYIDREDPLQFVCRGTSSTGYQGCATKGIQLS